MAALALIALAAADPIVWSVPGGAVVVESSTGAVLQTLPLGGAAQPMVVSETQTVGLVGHNLVVWEDEQLVAVWPAPSGGEHLVGVRDGVAELSGDDWVTWVDLGTGATVRRPVAVGAKTRRTPGRPRLRSDADACTTELGGVSVPGCRHRGDGHGWVALAPKEGSRTLVYDRAGALRFETSARGPVRWVGDELFVVQESSALVGRDAQDQVVWSLAHAPIAAWSGDFEGPAVFAVDKGRVTVLDPVDGSVRFWVVGRWSTWSRYPDGIALHGPEDVFVTPQGWQLDDRRQTGRGVASIELDGGRSVVGDGRRQIALEGPEGVIWQSGLTGHPIGVAGGHLVVQTGGVAGLDLETGELAWVADAPCQYGAVLVP